MSFTEVQEVFDKSGVSTPYKTFEADEPYELQRLELGGGSCVQRSKQCIKGDHLFAHITLWVTLDFFTEEQAKLEPKLEKAVLLHK